MIFNGRGSSEEFLKRVAAIAATQGLDCVAIISRVDSDTGELLKHLKNHPPTAVIPSDKKAEKFPFDRRSIKPLKINQRGSFGRH